MSHSWLKAVPSFALLLLFFVPISNAAATKQNVLVIAVNFQDTDYPFNMSSYEQTGNKLDAFFMENSFNKTGFNFSFFGPYKLPINRDCNENNIINELVKVSDADIYFPYYSHLVILSGYICGGFGLAFGAHTINSNDGSKQMMLVIEGGGMTFGTEAHEIGHNLGLAHANLLKCGDGVNPGDRRHTDCDSLGYADLYDTMGGPSSGGFHYGAFNKKKLGYFAPSNIVTASEGSFFLEPIEKFTSGIQAIIVPYNTTNCNIKPCYYLEYRQPIGFDARSIGGLNLKVNGTLIRIAPTSEGGTNLVDVHYASGHAFDAFLNESNIFRDSINFLEFKASGASPNGVWITISKMNRQGIRVDSNPPLANVYLDGFFKGISPLFIAGASLGAHQVKLTKPEYSDYSQNVVVSSGLTTYVNASMTAFPATLFVNSTPINASVSLFSESKGYTPILISNLTPRNYWIIVRKSGYQDWQKNVDLSPGQYLAEHAILVPRSVSPTPTSSPTPTPKGAIRGITTPTGASMRVDAISKGLTPLTITNLSVGSHSVGFTKTGYLPYSTTVPVVASATATVSAVLVPTPTPTATPTSIPTATPTATPSTGSIFASSNPALANLYINFQIRGLTPITVSNLTPGPATVQMSKQGYQTFQSVVDVIAGRTINVSANLTPTAAPTSSPTATITATPSVNATPTPSINATITPTPSVNATPSPYGSITPTPNATSTPTPIPPTNTQPPGGGYTGGNGGFPEPTSRAGATPAASSIPSLTPPPKGSYEEILTEVDELMEALPDRPDILEETGKYLETAQALEKAGRKEESVNLLEKAKVRLLSAIAESKTTKATFSWQFALIAIAVVASLAILHFVHIGVIEKKL